jgi:hypothetical protein
MSLTDEDKQWIGEREMRVRSHAAALKSAG